MANVIHIRRQPTGLEQAGQSMQELANNFIQHTLAMTQQQNAQNMQMMGLGMQERRLADANARDDRRWKENTAMQERRFAQEDKWKEAQLALQKQRLGMAYAKDADERAARKRLNDLLNGMSSPASGGAGGSIPGLDAAASRAADEVLSPGWSPMSSEGMGGQSGNMLSLPDAVSVRADASALDLNRRTDQELLEQAGLWPPKPQPTTGELMERAGLWPLKSSHAPTPGSQGDKNATMGLVLNAMKQSLGVPLNQQTETDRVLSGLAPMFGVQPDATPLQAESTPTTGESAPSPSAGPEMPQMPEPASLDVNGVKITVDNFPPQLLGSQQGQAIFNWLKSRDEANIKRYNMDMGAFEAAQKTGKSTHMPIDTAAKKDAFDLRSQWDEAMRVEKQLDAFAASGGAGGTGLLLGMLPQTIQNRIDPGGTNLRSAISQMSSVIMNALSGAAVSDQERVRLEGFLPTASDDLPTIRKKLEGYKDYIATKSASWRSVYGDIKPLADIQTGSGIQPAGAPAQSQSLAGASSKRFTFNPKTGRLE